MIIIGGDIFVESCDKFGDTKLESCRINCNFPLFKEGYVSPKLFEFRDGLEDRSEDFKSVFSKASMTRCELKGSDEKSVNGLCIGGPSAGEHILSNASFLEIPIYKEIERIDDKGIEPNDHTFESYRYTKHYVKDDERNLYVWR